MSLLLDALHRASKDKAKAVEAASNANLPLVAPIETAFAASIPPPVTDAASNFPELTLAPAVPAQSTTQSPSPPLPIQEPDLELTLEAAPVPAAEPATEPVLSPTIQAATATANENASSVSPPTAVLSAPAAMPANGATLKTSASEPQTQAAIAAVGTRVKPGWAERVAQDMRRAHAQPGPDTAHELGRRRRLVALGGLAVGLALALGSFSLGLWGDPAVLLGWSHPSSLTPLQPPPPVATVTTATVPDSGVSSTPVALAPASDASAMALAQPVVPPVPAAATSEVGLADPKGSPLGATERSMATAAAVPGKPGVAPTAVQTAVGPSLKGRLPGPVFSTNVAGPSALDRGYAALMGGRLDEAAAAYAEALKTNPDERDALLGQAYIYHERGQFEEAQTFYRKVLRQDPSNVVARAGLVALDAMGDAALTAGRARELAARQPDSAAALAMAGNAFVRDGLLADAARAFGQAQALEPGNAVYAYNHAVALDRLGQFAQALTHYDKVLSLAGAADARVFSVATVRQRRDQLQQAIATRAETVP